MNKKMFLTALAVGLVSSIAFILIQPLFGLSTLTSRHAAAYVLHGDYSENNALILSWVVHISVSVAYAMLSTFIFTLNRSLPVSIGQVVLLGWFTTLIATPANQLVVKVATTMQFPALSSLAPLNTAIGPKLWLHIVFFVFVLIGLWAATLMNKEKKD